MHNAWLPDVVAFFDDLPRLNGKNAVQDYTAIAFEGNEISRLQRPPGARFEQYVLTRNQKRIHAMAGNPNRGRLAGA
jgi:hypothetical protein